MSRVVKLSILCAVLAAVLLWQGLVQPPAQPAYQAAPRALLLVEDDTGTYPMQLRKGLQEALQALGGSVRSERLGDVDLNEQGLYTGMHVLYLLCHDPMQVLPLLPKQAPTVVFIGQEMRGQVCVVPDQEDGGWQAGLYIALTRPQKPVLLVGDSTSPQVKQRLEGALRGLGEVTSRVVTLAQVESPQQFSAVLALDGEATLALADMPLEGVPLYGFDAPLERVALLEQGLLQGVVADNPYSLGYLAGRLAEDARKGKLAPSLHMGPMRLVTPDTLYDAEHVKLMFPLLQ